MKKIPLTLFSSLCLMAHCAFASDARSYNSVPSDISLIETQMSSYTIEQKKQNGISVKLNTDISYIRGLKYFNYQDNLAAAYILLPYTKNNLNITTPLGNISDDSKQVGDMKVFLGWGLVNQPALERKDWLERKKQLTSASEHKKQYDILNEYSTVPGKVYEAVDGAIGKTIADKNERFFNLDTVTLGVTATLPTANYDPVATNNIGANRFAIKPEFAFSWLKGKWQTEWYSGLTFYTNNNKYQGNKKLEQKNIYNNELHISYNTSDNFWIGADLIHLYGGETSVNHVGQKDKYDNYSYGFIGNYKVAKNQNIKVTYQKTFKSTEFSPKVNGWAATYQVFW